MKSIHTEGEVVMKIKTSYPFKAAQQWPLVLLGAMFGILVLSCIEVQALPFTTYGSSGSSSVFAVSCSGAADGGLPNPNTSDNRIFFQAGSNCTSNALTSSASSSFTSGNVSASGTTTSSLGSISGAATMSTDAQNSVLFPAGFTDAGWIDTMLIQNAANNGLVGMATVILNVSGTLSASGPNVASLLQLAVSSELANNQALHQPFYQVQAPAPGLVVNDTLLLDLPFIIGTPSQFVVRAMTRAMTSSQTSGGNNIANVNFQNTLTWGGIDKVTVGGQEITSFTAIGVDSGIDWTQPFSNVSAAPVPEPSTFLLLGTGLLGFIGARVVQNRRHRTIRSQETHS